MILATAALGAVGFALHGRYDALLAGTTGALIRWVEPGGGETRLAAVPEGGILNPYTGTAQFYVDGPVEMTLAAGTYRLQVTKGIEYEVASREISIASGETTESRVELSRWIDPRARGWYSAAAAGRSASVQMSRNHHAKR